MYCKNCGAELSEGAGFCADCGVLVGNGDAYCPECGVQTNNGKRFCTKCGADLMGEAVLVKSDKPIDKMISNSSNEEIIINEIEKIVIPETPQNMLSVSYKLMDGFMGSKKKVKKAYFNKFTTLYQKAEIEIKKTPEFKKIKKIYLDVKQKAEMPNMLKLLGILYGAGALIALVLIIALT